MKTLFPLCLLLLLSSGCLLQEDPVSPDPGSRTVVQADTSGVIQLPLRSAGESSLPIVFSGLTGLGYTVGPEGLDLLAIDPDALTREVLYRSPVPLTSLTSADGGRLLIADVISSDTGRPLLLYDVRTRTADVVWLPHGTDAWVASPGSPMIAYNHQGQIDIYDITNGSSSPVSHGDLLLFSPDGRFLLLSRAGWDSPASRTILDLSSQQFQQVSHPGLSSMSKLQWTGQGLAAMHVGYFPSVGAGCFLLDLAEEGTVVTLFQWPMYVSIETSESRLSDDGSLAAFTAPVEVRGTYGQFLRNRYHCTIVATRDAQVITSVALDAIPTDYRFSPDTRYLFFRLGNLLLRKHLQP